MLSEFRETEITPHTFLWLMSTLGIKLIFHACFEEAVETLSILMSLGDCFSL